MFVPTSALAQWTNGQSAAFVVGQSGFGPGFPAAAADRLRGPTGISIDLPRGKMYVVDSENNRVLRFPYPITGNGPTAEAVFGQPSFTVNTVNNGGRSATSMATPMGCAVDTSGTLYVADTDNHRVLVFPSAHLAATTGTAAAKVLGQANFSSAAIAITQASLVVPSGCAFEAPDRLWIADSAPNRVIRHDNVSAKTDGALADGVLGQTSFTDPVPATSASGLDTPRNVTAYQGTLFVADVDNQRIIRHANAAAKANGAAADGVLGQPNFTSTGSSNGAANLNGGFGLAVDESGRLYVGQIGNHRVTLFDGAAGKANGAAAETVLGQIAFGTSFSSNLDNRMFDPHGVAVDSVNHRLVVADRSNHRVLIFQATAPLPVAVSTFTLD